jgi:hypothetical protein
MARLTVTQIMQQIASTVNQESAAPDAGNAEWGLWLQYINRSYFEWVDAHDWEVSRKVWFPSITTVSAATVPLPADFKKLAADVVLYNGEQSNGAHYGEALPEQEGLYVSTDKYVKVMGDPSNGYNILINPGTLASGASLAVQYFSTPTSLASGSEVPLIPDSQFLVDRAIAYIFEARSDPRFQQEETKARERLLTMIENADLAKYNSYASPNTVITPERKQGFRIGRD